MLHVTPSLLLLPPKCVQPALHPAASCSLAARVSCMPWCRRYDVPDARLAPLRRVLIIVSLFAKEKDPLLEAVANALPVTDKRKNQTRNVDFPSATMPISTLI